MLTPCLCNLCKAWPGAKGDMTHINNNEQHFKTKSSGKFTDDSAGSFYCVTRGS